MDKIVKQDGINFPANFTEKDRQVFLAQELSKCYVYVGQTSNKNDLMILTAAVSKLIQSDYPKMTDIDIQEAIYNGSLGRYGEIFGINLKTIEEWFRIYTRNRKEAAATAKRLREIDESRKTQEPTVNKAHNILKLLSENPEKVPSFEKLINKHTK